MDTHWLPDAIEPDYWNVVFHPSTSRLARLVLGEFAHVSACTYIPGFRCWIVYNNEWGGLRISFVNHGTLLIPYMRDCVVVKFDRRYEPLALLSRFGFYCVPAIKQLLGLSCVAATPDALYRHLIKNGGVIIGQRIDPAAATARSDAATGTSASTKPAC
jgi:hypothetical protein